VRFQRKHHPVIVLQANRIRVLQAPGRDVPGGERV
jgi:hypothetical protein